MNITINLDEISSDFNRSLKFLKDNNISSCELRLINNENICFIKQEKLQELKKNLESNNIKPIAIASPIFKWFLRESSDSFFEIDNYGVFPEISNDKKIEITNNIINIARFLNVKFIRVFSGINDSEIDSIDFVNSDIFRLLTENGDLTFLVENEPVCQIKTLPDLYKLVEYLEKKNIKNFGVWLDIANLLRIGEKITSESLSKLQRYIQYIHIKDYIINERSNIDYTTVGKGIIDYRHIFKLLKRYIEVDSKIISLETHEKNESMKYFVSEESMSYLKTIIQEVIDDD